MRNCVEHLVEFFDLSQLSYFEREEGIQLDFSSSKTYNLVELVCRFFFEFRPSVQLSFSAFVFGKRDEEKERERHTHTQDLLTWLV